MKAWAIKGPDGGVQLDRGVYYSEQRGFIPAGCTCVPVTITEDAQEPASAPDGMVLVPREPTEAHVSETLQLFRSELDKNMDLKNHCPSPGHSAMRVALRHTFIMLAAQARHE